MSLFSPPPASFPDSPYALRKRKADIDLEHPPDSPLTKRFRRLNIRGPPSKVTKRSTSSTRNNNSNNLTAVEQPWSNINLSPPPFPRPHSPPPAAMDVDETPYRIFVNDLDASSSDEAEDERETAQSDNPVIFLSDVEREMSRIPIAVLKASSTASSVQPSALPTARSSTGSSTDLILYRPPKELVDDSSVRQVIQEAKARIRMRNADAGAGSSIGVVPPVVEMSDGMGFTSSPESYVPSAMPDSDPDAMMLDDL
ncbi:hypothetical protein ABW21_db0201937 [Orbilia brochopaga]|nr:hypothetical protein ABW21_db0201937 [Drechslerella brochopaga]